MPINLNGKATVAAKQLAQAFQGDDPAALEAAFETFQREVLEDSAEQYRELMEQHDEQVLAQRGFPQLTQRETEYFTDIIQALKSPDWKQALATIAAGDHNVPARMMPETIIDEILRDLEETHPLLKVVHATNVGYVTTWLRNKHTKQLAVWGAVEAAVTQEITSAFELVQVTQGKLSCYCAVSRDMLELGPRWMAGYVRTVLGEAMACGMEYGVVKGKGIGGEPIGLNRSIAANVSVHQTNGYPKKTAVEVTDFMPASYGAVVANLAKDDAGHVKRSIADLTMVVNLVDYLTKVMPATTVRATDGRFVNDLFPIPTNVITSEFVDTGEAILFLPSEYDLLVGGNRGIEASDDAQFLADMRVFKVISYAYGHGRDESSAVLLDISNIDPAYVTVLVAGQLTTVAATTEEEAAAGDAANGQS